GGIGVTKARRDAPAHGSIAEDQDISAIRRPVGNSQERFQDTLAYGVTVFRELLDRAVVDHQDGSRQLRPELGESHTAGGRLLGATEQLSIPVVTISR